jgi:hypothetical protein
MVPMRQRCSSPWITIVPVAVAIVVFAAACTSAPPARSPDAATSETPSSAMAEVLDFTAPQLGGGTLEGADYAGKDTAIWFWAPW